MEPMKSNSHRNLLKGPTAYELGALEVKFLIAMLATLGCMAIAFFIANVSISWLNAVFLVALVCSSLPGAVFIMWSEVKEQAEKRAGYTTLPSGYKQLEQRDPYLGVVIREPGGDFLDADTFREIRDRAKAAAQMFDRKRLF